MAGAGSVIMAVGMTSVFVPQDLRYLGLTIQDLHAINPRLAPLIAHDRAGFGGGLLSCGLMITLIVWKTPIRAALWQALFIAGGTGFSARLASTSLSATRTSPTLRRRFSARLCSRRASSR